MRTKSDWMLWVWCAVGVLGLGLYIINIHAGSLKAWDEGLTALRSFEMFSSNAFPTTYMLGHPDFNKPPLYYWLSAQTMNVLGVSILSVRLPGVVMALLTHLMAGALVWRRVAAVELRLLAVCLLLFNAHWMDHVRIGLLESGVACSMVGALWLVDTVRIPRLFRVVGAGCLLGCGTLLKHPGVLLALLPIGYLLRQEGRQGWTRDVLVVGSIGLGFYAAWVVHQYLTWGADFVSYYFNYNIYERFGHGIEGHATAAMYYLERLFMKAPVTGGLFVGALAWAGWHVATTRRLSFELVLLATFALPFGVLHLFASKREVYLVSLYPFLAVAVPLLVQTAFATSLCRRSTGTRWVVLGVVLIQLACFVPRFDYVPEYSRAEKQAVEAAIRQTSSTASPQATSQATPRASHNVVGTEGMPIFLSAFYAHMYAVQAVDLKQCEAEEKLCSVLVLPTRRRSTIPSTEVFRNQRYAVRVVR